MVATRAGRIQWSDEERRQVLERGREIHLEHPELTPRALIARAQEVLPEGRRRGHLRNDPPRRFEWFTRGLGATPPAPEGARKSRVFWSNTELEKILARAREIRDATGLQNGRSLIDRAQRDVLPEGRWRARGSLQGDRIDWMLARMAEWPPLVAPAPPAPPAPDPPEPPDPLAAARSLGTRDLLAVVAERLFCTLSGGLAMIAEALDEMRTRQAEDHDLLFEVLGSLEPRGGARGVAEVPTHVPAPTPPQQPARRPRTRPRVCLIGGSAEWGEGVVRGVEAAAEVTHEPKADLARNKGFRGYDLVVITPIAGHSATERAKKDLGHQNVFYVPHTGATKVADEIRTILAKRAAKAATNGAAHN